jgi:adenylate kinase
MLEIVRRKVEPITTRGWLLDGYPRTLPQAQQLDKWLDTIGQKLSHVFFLELSEQTIIERIQGWLVQ